MISPDSKLSISGQCEILGISRSCHYYKPSPEAEENKEIMDKIDREHTNHPGISANWGGKGRCKDNIRIERFWRTIKYDNIYINPMDDGLELYAGIKQYINYYNTERHHQGIDHQIPSKLYLNRVETAV